MRTRLLSSALAAAGTGLIAAAAALGAGSASETADRAGAKQSYSGGAADTRARAAAARPFRLGGLTSKKWPLYAEVSANGRMLRQMHIGIEENCTSGGVTAWPSGVEDVRINKRGAFKLTDHYDEVDDGERVQSTLHLSGKFDRRRQTLTGKWREVTTYTLVATGARDDCDTGTVGFTARR